MLIRLFRIFEIRIVFINDGSFLRWWSRGVGRIRRI
jgi:hypothetical protein